MTELIVLKKIPDSLATEGMQLKLIRRTGAWAIYKGQTSHYEIHKIRTIKLRPSKFTQSMIDEGFTHKETLASSEEFGRHAWSVSDLQRALEIAQNICSETVVSDIPEIQAQSA